MRLRLIIAASVLWTLMLAYAWAHAGLTSTTPADGKTVEGEVSNIELTFSEAVRVTLIKVTREDASKTMAVKSELPGTFVQAVEVAVPPLTPGNYNTKWTAVSKDGHVMTGSFSFTVAD